MNVPPPRTDLSLCELLSLQHDLQRRLETDPLDMTVDERIEYIRWNVLACTNELHEALAEVDWKPWTNGQRVIYQDRVLAELVDALHFLCNLILAATPDGAADSATKIDVLARSISLSYKRKRERNIDRRSEGYDGRSDKCVGCLRDLVDVGVRVVDGSVFCLGCGGFVRVA